MVNETVVVLYGQLLTGRKYVPKANGVVELEKQWAKQVLPFAFQTVVKVHVQYTKENTIKTHGNIQYNLLSSIKLVCLTIKTLGCGQRKISRNHFYTHEYTHTYTHSCSPTKT